MSSAERWKTAHTFKPTEPCNKTHTNLFDPHPACGDPLGEKRDEEKKTLYVVHVGILQALYNTKLIRSIVTSL